MFDEFYIVTITSSQNTLFLVTVFLSINTYNTILFDENTAAVPDWTPGTAAVRYYIPLVSYNTYVLAVGVIVSCWCPTYVRSRTNRSGTKTGTSVLFSCIIRVRIRYIPIISHELLYTWYLVDLIISEKYTRTLPFVAFHMLNEFAQERGTAKDNQPRLCASVCTILGSAREQRQPGRSSSYTSTRTRKEVHIKAHHQRPVKISSEYVRNTILGTRSYIRTDPQGCWALWGECNATNGI